jgi:hypothetical protein
MPPNYGLTPLSAEAFLGGGGGCPLLGASNSATGLDIAVNGSQTVILALVGNSGFQYAALLVSSDGLASYVPYFTGRGASPGIGGIVFDGSKYVIATFQNVSSPGATYPIMFFRSIYSTTDFVNFTDHSLGGLQSAGGSNQTDSTFQFKFLNGRYFLCLSDDLYYSTDLNSWTRANVAGGTNLNIVSVAYDGTFYYAMQTTGSVRRSSNLSSWTAYATGAGTQRGIAASPTVVVVTSSSTVSRFSTDQGVTWSNLPTIPANVGRRVEYFSATGDWLLVTSGSQMYYSTSPATSWALSTVSGIPAAYTPIAYNGTRYILGAQTATAAYTSTTAAGTFASQAFTTISGAATAGGPGGTAAGGGGGAASSTTTTNGGAGGNGLCRVYTW